MTQFRRLLITYGQFLTKFYNVWQVHLKHIKTTMETVSNIVIGLVVSGIWVLSSVLGTMLWRCFYIHRPTKKMWGLYKPEEALIITATTKVDKGEYEKLSTGEGQLKAIPYIVTSLHKAYRKFDFQRICFSGENIGGNIEKDVILLGGPRNNQRVEDVFEHLNSEDKVGLFWADNGDITWNAKTYRAEILDGKVIRDFGIVIKMNNYFLADKKTKLLLFSGSHTYGVIAAARYFCCFSRKDLGREINKNYILLISCDVLDNHPTNIKLINKMYLP